LAFVPFPLANRWPAYGGSAGESVRERDPRTDRLLEADRSDQETVLAAMRGQRENLHQSYRRALESAPDTASQGGYLDAGLLSAPTQPAFPVLRATLDRSSNFSSYCALPAPVTSLID